MRRCQALDAGQGQNQSLQNQSLQNQSLQKDSLFVSTPIPNFGMVVVGSSKTLTNSFSKPTASSIAITRAPVDKADSGISGPSLLQTLVLGQISPRSITFAPRTHENSKRAVRNPYTVFRLSGTAINAGELTIQRTTINNLQVCDNISAGGVGEFRKGICTTTASLVLLQCWSHITFCFDHNVHASTTSGTFLSNASNTPALEYLSGNGSPALPYCGSRSWNTSTSPVGGYNVYQSTLSGGPYTKITSTLDIATIYADNTVQAGQTYYRVVTGVGSRGAEMMMPVQLLPTFIQRPAEISGDKLFRDGVKAFRRSNGCPDDYEYYENRYTLCNLTARPH